MKKTNKIALGIIALIIIGIFGFLFFVLSNIQITGNIVKDSYTYTKAVCNNTNNCEDYEVICEGDEMIGFIPTGAVVQFSDEWKDPRSKEEIEREC
jgi:hypothetical protein